MMIKQVRSSKAQILSEYALTLFLVVGVLTAMTVYIRRVLQARIFEARTYMFNTVKSAPHVGKLKMEYEPYYVQTTSMTDETHSEELKTLGGGHTGIFRKTFEDEMRVQSNSVQLPPANAD